jgi:hypothetical protein
MRRSGQPVNEAWDVGLCGFLLEDREPPHWGLLLCPWERAARLTPVEVLELWDRRRALWRRGVSVRVVFPLALDELWDRLIGVVPHRPFRWKEG